MKTRLNILLITAAISVSSTFAQQLPESNLYSFNKYGINPAYTGFNQCLEAYGSRLSQWVGIDGAPTTNYFSVHTGLNENMGLGAGIVYDKATYISRFSGKLSYAYRVKLGEDHNLRFGLSGGVYQVKYDASNAIVMDVTDEVISGGAQSGMAFESEFGLFYNLKNLQVGFSVPNIFETKTNLDLANLDGFQGKRHYVGYAGYDFEINDKWNIEPSVLYKSVIGLTQIDVNALVTFNNMISIGGGYRNNVGPLARIGINIKDMVMLGYAYEFAGMNISKYSSGSHEIMLGIKFCKDRNNDPIVEKPSPKPEVVAVKKEEPKEVITPVVEEPIIKEVPKEIVEEKPVIKEEIIETEPKVQPLTAQEKSYFNKTLNFSISKAAINNTANADLDKIVQVMEDHPEMKIKVKGHSCDLGSAAVKQKVSDDRAKMVKDYLKNKGIQSDRIKTIGLSDSKSVVPNTSEENRVQNRRVEFEIVE